MIDTCHDGAVESAGQAPDDGKAGRRRVDQGSGPAHARACSGIPPFETPRSDTRSPAAIRCTLFPSPHLLTTASPSQTPMDFETKESNLSIRPLGTGLVSLQMVRNGESWRRSTHGPKGTARGNGGSAAQGGIRSFSESLPFKTSVRHHSIVGAMPKPSCGCDPQRTTFLASPRLFSPLSPQRSSSCP